MSDQQDTTTTPTHDQTLDLSGKTAFEAAMAVYEHTQQVRRATLEDEQQAKARQNRLLLDTLRARIEQQIPDVLLEQLSPGIGMHVHDNEAVVTFTLPDPENPWFVARLEVRYWEPKGGRDKPMWVLDQKPGYRIGTFRDDDLATAVMYHLGEQIQADRARRAKEAKAAQERAARDAEADRLYKLQRQQAEAEEQRRLEEHQRCVAEVEAFKQTQRDQLWTWPEGVTITLYHCAWATAAGADGSGEGAEYDSGWATSDQPDARGYYTFLGEHYRSDPREVRFVAPEASKPVFQRLRFSRTDALPDALRYTKHVRCPGIRTSTHYSHELGRTLLEHYEPAVALDGLHVEIGEEPVAELRAYLDQERSR